MNKRFMIWENPRDAVLSIVFILMALGCMNVFSASFVRADAMFHDSYYFFETISDVGRPGSGEHVAHRL